MNAERFAAILEAYGADPRRWPAAERAAAEAWSATADGARSLRAAARLDEILDADPVAFPSAELRARVLDARPRGRRGFLGLAPWRMTWAPGAALAGAGVAGIVFGAALSQGWSERQTDVLLAETDAYDVAALDLSGEPS